MVTCSGKIPSKRADHFLFYESPYVIMGFGCDKQKRLLSDLFCLNVENWVWKRFFSLEGPNIRYRPVVATYPGCCLAQNYIIGGVSLPDHLAMGDIWSFSLDNVPWTNPTMDLPGLKWKKIVLKEGVLPFLKYPAGCAITNGNCVIFGGYDSSGTPQAGTYIINFGKDSLFKKIL